MSLEIKRYYIQVCDEYPWCEPMEESPSGDYVTWVDHEQIVKKLKSQFLQHNNRSGGGEKDK